MCRDIKYNNYYLMYNNIIQTCANLALNRSNLVMCRNLRLLQWEYNINCNILDSNTRHTKAKNIILSHANPALLATASFVLDVIYRNENFLNNENYADILFELCCQ